MVEQAARTPSPQNPSSVINPDKSVNAEVLAKMYGLRVEDALKPANYGKWQGTVAEMLDNAACPVGGRVKNAFEKEGIGGVLKTFNAFKTLGVDIQVTPETIDMHENGTFQVAAQPREERIEQPVSERLDAEPSHVEHADAAAADGEQIKEQPAFETRTETRQEESIVSDVEAQNVSVGVDVSEESAQPVELTMPGPASRVEVDVMPSDVVVSNSERVREQTQEVTVPEAVVVDPVPDIRAEIVRPVIETRPRQVVAEMAELHATTSEPVAIKTVVYHPQRSPEPAFLHAKPAAYETVSQTIRPEPLPIKPRKDVPRIDAVFLRTLEEPDTGREQPPKAPRVNMMRTPRAEPERPRERIDRKKPQIQRQEGAKTKPFEQTVAVSPPKKETKRTAGPWQERISAVPTKREPVPGAGELIAASDRVRQSPAESSKPARYQRERRMRHPITTAVEVFDAPSGKLARQEMRGARQKAVKESSAIVIKRTEGKIIISSSRKDTESKTIQEKPALSTASELNSALKHVSELMRGKKEDRVGKKKKEKAAQKVEVIVSAALMEAVRELTIPAHPDRTKPKKKEKDMPVKKARKEPQEGFSITFSTNTKDKKKLTIDSNHLLKIQESFALLARQETVPKKKVLQGKDLFHAAPAAAGFMLREGSITVLKDKRKPQKERVRSNRYKAKENKLATLSAKGGEIRIELEKLRKILELQEQNKQAGEWVVLNPEGAPEEILGEDNQTATGTGDLIQWLYVRMLFYVMFSLQEAS